MFSDDLKSNLNELLKGLEKLPELSEILLKSIKSLNQISGILGLVVSGSVSRGQADSYSDLDLLLIAEDEEFQIIWNNRKNIEASIGEVIFRVDLVEVMPTSAVTFFLNGIKLHFTYKSLSQLVPELEYREAKILISKSVEIIKWLHNCDNISHDIDKILLIKSDERFWFWALQGTNKIARGEFWASLDTLNILRSIYISSYSNFNNIPFEGYRRIETLWPAKNLDILNETISTIKDTELIKSYSLLINTYSELRMQMFERMNIQFTISEHSLEWIKRSINQYLVK